MTQSVQFFFVRKVLHNYYYYYLFLYWVFRFFLMYYLYYVGNVFAPFLLLTNEGCRLLWLFAVEFGLVLCGVLLFGCWWSYGGSRLYFKLAGFPSDRFFFMYFWNFHSFLTNGDFIFLFKHSQFLHCSRDRLLSKIWGLSDTFCSASCQILF